MRHSWEEKNRLKIQSEKQRNLSAVFFNFLDDERLIPKTGQDAQIIAI
jgi:hypothetical protein